MFWSRLGWGETEGHPVLIGAGVGVRLVLIEWQDSLGCSTDWQPLAACDPVPLICKSVGWLLHDGSDCKVVVPHISANENPGIEKQGCGDMSIPSRSVLKMTFLSVPKSRRKKSA